jgi:hypothetical protein
MSVHGHVHVPRRVLLVAYHPYRFFLLSVAVPSSLLFQLLVAFNFAVLFHKVNDGEDDDDVAFVLTGRMILIDGSFGPSRQVLSTVVPNPERVISRLRWKVCVGGASDGDGDGDDDKIS